MSRNKSDMSAIRNTVLENGRATIRQQRELLKDAAGDDSKIKDLLVWLLEDVGMPVGNVIVDIKCALGADGKPVEGKPRREALSIPLARSGRRSDVTVGA